MSPFRDDEQEAALRRIRSSELITIDRPHKAINRDPFLAMDMVTVASQGAEDNLWWYEQQRFLTI